MTKALTIAVLHDSESGCLPHARTNYTNIHMPAVTAHHLSQRSAAISACASWWPFLSNRSRSPMLSRSSPRAWRMNQE